MRIDRWAQPALIIVDMQNDFVREGSPMEVPDARATIPQHQTLIKFFRTANLPIIYTRYLAGDCWLLWNWSPELAAPTNACQLDFQRYYKDVDKTLNCVDVIDEIYPEQGDHIIDKYGYGAFHKTTLDDLLEKLGVESLILTGTVTQICVEETARQAFHHGYKTTLVSDAVSSYLPDLHAATLKNFRLKFGWVSTTEEVIAALRERLKSHIAG